MVRWKASLVRIAAFLLVGILVVASTQMLRGSDPVEASANLRKLLRSITGGATRDAAALDAVTEVHANVAQPLAAPPHPMVERVSRAAAETAKPTKSVPQECRASEPAAGSVVIGDRLQLRYFAKVDVRDATALDGNGVAEAVPMAFERLDLSGTYEVSEDGAVALPLLGRIALVGQTLACAEAIIVNSVNQIDPSVSAVTATFSSRLPVTVSGAIRAPGAYTYSPGMTVDRLLGLSGATFSDTPITPQEFEALQAQREELQRRLVTAALEKQRFKAVLDGQAKLDLSESAITNAPPEIIASLVAAESAALTQDLAVNRMSDERRTVEIEGLVQKVAEIEKQLDLVSEQLANLQSRQDEVTTLKSKGLLQASQLDTLIANVMELHRIQMQLATEHSNLASQIALAKEDAGLDIERRKQDLARRISDLSGEISLLELQQNAVESRLAAHGLGAPGSDRELPLLVTIRRNGTKDAYRLDATWNTVLFPGDLVRVTLLPNGTAQDITGSSRGRVVRSDDVSSAMVNQ